MGQTYTAYIDGEAVRKPYAVQSLDAPVYTDEDCSVSLVDTIEDASNPNMEERVESADTARIVREAVAELESADVRESIQAYYFENKAIAKIAMEQGETVNTDTRFYAHKGVEAFWNSRSSVVEDAVLWREKQREMYADTEKPPEN